MQSKSGGNEEREALQVTQKGSDHHDPPSGM